MARSPTLAIAGAIEEMECGGKGCPGCPHRIAEREELACRVSIPGEPIALARDTLRSLNVKAPATGEIGRSTDVGRVYDVEELSTAVAFLEQSLALLDGVLDEEAFAGGRDLLEERTGIELALRLFRTAREHHKRVVLEV